MMEGYIMYPFSRKKFAFLDGCNNSSTRPHKPGKVANERANNVDLQAQHLVLLISLGEPAGAIEASRNHERGVHMYPSFSEKILIF
jgi:hypothetical protein